MNSNKYFGVWGTKRAVLAGILAASTVAFAQDSSVPNTTTSNSSTQQQSTTSSSGWKRVGDQAQVSNPNTDGGATQADPSYGQNSPAPYSNQQGNYPNQQQAPQYPNGQPSYGTAGGNGYPVYGQQQQGYPSQAGPNGQYGAQQNYPAPPPVPAQLTMQAGTYLTVRVNQMLSSDKNQPGDAFTASLVQPVVVNGVVVAEPGQTVGGRVVTAEKHHIDKPARLGLQLTNLSLVDGQQVPVATQFISRQGGTTGTGTEVGTVATTTGVGAAIGAIAGWGTGAAIGAGAGAAAGLIGVLITHNHASVIYPEQVLTFRVDAPVTISTSNSTQAFRYIQPNEYDRPVYSNYSPNGSGMYESASPAQPVYNNYYASGYPYYGYGYGWGYPYYWGPSFAFYGGYWGGRYYRPYYGGRGFYGGGRAYAGGGFRGGAGGGFHGAVGGHVGGGHR